MLSAAKGGFTNATDIADYLVKKGTPFRVSHEIIGKMVAYCIKNNKNIDELTLQELKSFSEKFESDVYEAISLETCVNERKLPGGPAKVNVKNAITKVKRKLNI